MFWVTLMVSIVQEYILVVWNEDSIPPSVYRTVLILLLLLPIIRKRDSGLFYVVPSTYRMSHIYGSWCMGCVVVRGRFL